MTAAYPEFVRCYWRLACECTWHDWRPICPDSKDTPCEFHTGHDGPCSFDVEFECGCCECCGLFNIGTGPERVRLRECIDAEHLGHAHAQWESEGGRS